MIFNGRRMVPGRWFAKFPALGSLGFAKPTAAPRCCLRGNCCKLRTFASLGLEKDKKITLWCEKVVFSNHERTGTHSLTLDRGSVDIIDGLIVECHPGEGWSDAQTRNPRGAQRLDIERSRTTNGAGQKGQTVLSPGLIDVHTHISALGRNWEGYETATMAASAGGITTIFGMPLNSIPPTTTLEAVELERQAVYKAKHDHQSLFVDVGLWGGVVPDNLETAKDTQRPEEKLESLLESPYVFGLKAFLAPLPPAAGYQNVSAAQLLQAAKICGPTGKPILVHSELMTQEDSSQATQDAFGEKNDKNDRDSAQEVLYRSYAAHLASRPSHWEQEAVKVVCRAAALNCRMHIVHLSDATGCLPIISAFKENEWSKRKQTSSLTVETCPHYLLLDESQISDGDTRLKCFPPIRDSKNRELLWEGLTNKSDSVPKPFEAESKLGEEGIRFPLIDMVASDHSPCEPHLRQMEEGNFKTAWGGLSALQYQLQATWTEAVKRGHSPIDLALWWSERPAKLAGVDAYKGKIAPGHQADLCWWNPHHIGPPSHYSREYHRWPGTSYFADNPVMNGRVLGTWVKGNLVYDGIEDQHNFGQTGELLATMPRTEKGV